MYDLIVIGGGISGLGVVKAAVSKGLSVALCEGSEVAKATSNNTLRIIHGGFRYLQNLDFTRMVKSLRDQRDLICEVPEAVRVLPCVMPLNRFGLKSAIPVSVASQMYGIALSMTRSPVPRPRVVSAQSLGDRIPFLRGRVPHGFLEWHDVLMQEPLDVAKYLVHFVKTKGAEVYERRPIARVSPQRDGTWTVIDSAGAELQTRALVSTLGPWANVLDDSSGVQPFTGGWCKGFNIVVKKQFDPVHAIGIENKDKRLFFVVPRGSGSAIGTWYVPCTQPHRPHLVEESEIVDFVTAFNTASQGEAIVLDDIISVDVGVLPTTCVRPTGPELLGNELYLSAPNYIKVISTKYTTFRSQGEEAVRRVLQMRPGSACVSPLSSISKAD